jgi:hypothetical protein
MQCLLYGRTSSKFLAPSSCGSACVASADPPRRFKENGMGRREACSPLRSARGPQSGVRLVTQKTSTSQIAWCSARSCRNARGGAMRSSKNARNTKNATNTTPLNSMAHHSTHGAAGRGWLELKVRTTPTHASSAATREVFSAGIMIQCPVRLVFRLELAGAGFRWLDRVAERVGRAAL